MKKIFTILAAVCIATVMSGCFSPWTGGHGTITIGFGDTVDFGARSAVLPGEIPYLVHAVTLTGPGGQTVYHDIIGGTTANISVPAGIWHIRVRADGTQGLRALGFGQVEVVAGQDAPAVITMSSAAEVSNHAQLDAAINNARTDGLEKIILVTQNIYVLSPLTITGGRNITFASANNVAIRRATGHPLHYEIFSEAGGTFTLGRAGLPGSVYVAGITVHPRGSGTMADPFRVNNAAQLRMVGRGQGNPPAYHEWTYGAHYLLVTNIALDGGPGWVPISVFHGSFNGGGFTISGLNVVPSSSGLDGMFGMIGGLDGGNIPLPGLVRDLNLVVSVSSDASNVGGLAGNLTSGSTVYNVNVQGTVSGIGDVGGIVGSIANGSTVRNSNSFANVIGDMRVGGIAGINASQSTVENSVFNGTVLANEHTAGGIVGENDHGTVRHNTARGTISGHIDELQTLGGIVGRNVGGIEYGNTTAGITFDLF